MILIVEDELDLAHVCRAALATEGHIGHIATSPQAAADEAADLQVDAILLDMMMPGYDGYAVARDLAANPRTARIPIVVMSALHRVKDRADEIGTPWSLAKPYNLADLFGVLNDVAASVAAA